MHKNYELTATEIHLKIRQYIYGEQKSISSLAKLSGLDDGTINQALNGQFSERTKQRLVVAFRHLETKPTIWTNSYPTTLPERRRRTLFVLIKLAIANKLGWDGKPYQDEAKDSLLIGLKATYNEPSNDNWQSVNLAYKSALRLRYGDLFEKYRLYLSPKISALQLVKKLQVRGEFIRKIII